jgi:hypothetical protein
MNDTMGGERKVGVIAYKSNEDDWEDESLMWEYAQSINPDVG